VVLAGLVVVGYGLLAALYASRDVAQAQTTALLGGPPTGKPDRRLACRTLLRIITALGQEL
jgi:hypothetical protein